MDELLGLSLIELTEVLRARKASPVELMQAVLARQPHHPGLLHNPKVRFVKHHRFTPADQPCQQFRLTISPQRFVAEQIRIANQHGRAAPERALDNHRLSFASVHRAPPASKVRKNK